MPARVSSRHRKPQRLAAAAHVHRRKAGGSQAPRGAVALFAEFEPAFARAKPRRAAPVQRLVPEFDGAALAVDGFGKAENLFWLPGDIGMQAFARIDAVPAAADHRLAAI